MQVVVADLRNARLAAGLSQAAIARAIGRTHGRISHWERGQAAPSLEALARWSAAVGLDLRLNLYPSGSPLRDAGQIRLLGRARAAIGDCWAWSTEVPVTADPLDRRAFDAVLARGGIRIGLEAVTRMIDAQAQVRSLMLKRNAGGVDRLVMVLADTPNNRSALQDAAPSLEPALPLRTRAVLAALRMGKAPDADGVMVV